jgi:membrane carboxypeptidase/penicillin-binding protein
LTAVWIGYVDNTPMGLTGAGAALPVWSEITKQLDQLYEPEPLALPDGVEDRVISRAELAAKFPRLLHLPEQVRLTFTRR